MLLGTLLLASSVQGDDIGHDEARRLRERGVILPLHEIVVRSTPSPDARLIEAELEREEGRLIYELEFLSSGEVTELRVDAASGDVLRREPD